MRTFEGTDLPDDFFYQVRRYANQTLHNRQNAVPDAVLAILGRPLTHQERMSIADAAHAGRLTTGMYSVDSEASAGSK
jgi:hypothetical protein